MENLLPILVGLAIGLFATQIALIGAVTRALLRDRRSRLEREARQARRNQPVVRPLLP